MTEDGGLPAGWEVVSGGEIFQFVRGVTFKASDAQASPGDGLVGVLRAGNIQSGTLVLDDLVYVDESHIKPAQRLREGDIVIATSSGSIRVVGKAATVTQDSPHLAFGAFCGLLRPYPGATQWLSAYLQTKEYRNLVSEKARGVNINNLKRDHLVSLPIRLPPLGEQRRIVSRVQEIREHSDAAKEALDLLPPLLERFRRSMLAAAFRGDLTRDWRARNPDVEPASVLLEGMREERRARFIEASAERARLRAEARAVAAGKVWTEADDHKALARERAKAERKYKAPEPWSADPDQGQWLHAELPAGWCWASFEELFTDETDSKRKLPQKRYLDAGPLPVIDQGEETIGGYTDDEELVHQGRLPMVVFGDHTRCVKFLSVPFVQGADGVKVLRPSPRVEPRFAYWCLGALRLPDKGYSRHSKFLRASRFPLPPLEEQRALVAAAEAGLALSDGAAAQVHALASEVGRLNHAILAKAFRGELVPQDPHDEPAGVLLERIRAERDLGEGEKKGAGRPRPQGQPGAPV